MEDQTLNEDGELEGADVDSTSDFDDTYTSDEDGETSDSKPDLLSELKKITGREFKDEADFEKHYKNLSSFVGKKVTPKTETKVSGNDEIKELRFKVDHPEYKDHFDVIKMVSKERGKSYDEVLSDNLVKELIEVRQSKKGESVIHSNNKISSSNSSTAKLKASVNTEEGLAAYLQATLED